MKTSVTVTDYPQLIKGVSSKIHENNFPFQNEENITVLLPTYTLLASVCAPISYTIPLAGEINVTTDMIYIDVNDINLLNEANVLLVLMQIIERIAQTPDCGMQLPQDAFVYRINGDTIVVLSQEYNTVVKNITRWLLGDSIGDRTLGVNGLSHLLNAMACGMCVDVGQVPIINHGEYKFELITDNNTGFIPSDGVEYSDLHDEFYFVTYLPDDGIVLEYIFDDENNAFEEQLVAVHCR